MRLGKCGVESIREDWDRLADELRAPPFQRPGWVAAWWQAFGRGSLGVLTVRVRDRITGIVPISNDGGYPRSPSNSETPIFSFLSEDDQSARLLADGLLRDAARGLDLSPLSVEDPGLQALREEADSRGFHSLTRTVLLSPYVNTDRDWTTYQESLDSKVRREIRRRQRRLAELGELRLEVIDGSERLHTLLEEGFTLEASGWKAAYGTAINSHPRRLAFYSEVARWADEQGWLRLAFLRLDGRAIAFDLCLEADHVHFLLKTGFDRRFQKFGPGLILRSMMVQRAFEGPIHTYEFLGTIIGTNNRWKLDWTNQYSERVRFQAFPPSMTGAIGWWRARYSPSLSSGIRLAAGRVLGPTGRDVAKRGRALLRRLLHR